MISFACKKSSVCPAFQFVLSQLCQPVFRECSELLAEVILWHVHAQTHQMHRLLDLCHLTSWRYFRGTVSFKLFEHLQYKQPSNKTKLLLYYRSVKHTKKLIPWQWHLILIRQASLVMSCRDAISSRDKQQKRAPHSPSANFLSCQRRPEVTVWKDFIVDLTE